MESYEQCGQGRSYCSLCTLDTIHKLFFVTRLIINNINKVQWVDFKLENVLVSLHSLKTMGLGPFGALAPLFLRNGELLGHSPIHTCLDQHSGQPIVILLSSKITKSSWRSNCVFSYTVLLKKYTQRF